MIARVWHGIAPESKTSEHLTYIQAELFRAYREAAGNRGAILLCRRRTDCTEFLVLSLWESTSSLESLTGPDVEGVLARELINPSPVVKNYEVVVSTLASPAILAFSQTLFTSVDKDVVGRVHLSDSEHALVSLVSVSARNWCYSCGKVERVETGEIVEIGNIHAGFMQVAEKMLG